MKRYGKLIGASLGPGDPLLITRRSWDVLQSDARWIYPVKKAGTYHGPAAVMDQYSGSLVLFYIGTGFCFPAFSKHKISRAAKIKIIHIISSLSLLSEIILHKKHPPACQ